MAKMTKAQIQANLRNSFYQSIQANVDLEDFDFIGNTVEGLAYQAENGQVVIVKAIVKAESFDLDDALEEFADKTKARLEREAKALEKAKAEEEKKAKAKPAKQMELDPSEQQIAEENQDSLGWGLQE